MRARQGISPCPTCAAQAVLTAALCQEIAWLQAEVKRLQVQLAQTSANSHKPPSSDPPTRTRVKARELSTRQPAFHDSVCSLALLDCRSNAIRLRSTSATLQAWAIQPRAV